ncbi:hypothetical protein pVco14_002 [Vibrio phage pVco-14]|nr:hypothetical protein pVco14_002 [Vibrio phage pVco-14]
MLKSLPTRLPVMHAFKTGSPRTLDITFISPTGNKTETKVSCTLEQYERWLNKEDKVPSIFPLLDREMQELFISGMGPLEYERFHGVAL